MIAKRVNTVAIPKPRNQIFVFFEPRLREGVESPSGSPTSNVFEGVSPSCAPTESMYDTTRRLTTDCEEGSICLVLCAFICVVGGKTQDFIFHTTPKMLNRPTKDDVTIATSVPVGIRCFGAVLPRPTCLQLTHSGSSGA